ncbi:MAG TPA: glycosyl hydrolase family 65 protein, partial [Cryomorphaceae bacterium]|nr:glycosyl hydrolase family 65 protein [Cryomorphaceae bacterium]
SKLVHSWVKARSERAASWESFEEALVSDFEDVQGGTTSEGIHLGAMAGTVDLMQRCYSGVRIYPDRLSIHPMLPKHIKQINFKLHYRSKWMDVKINHEKLQVDVTEGWGPEIQLTLDGKTHKMKVGDSKTVAFKKK